jgi:hypothetical protein
MSGTSSMLRGSKHSRSVANLPSISAKSELIALKQRKEFEMNRIMREELEHNQMKKLTEQKYEMLMNKEREQQSL